MWPQKSMILIFRLYLVRRIRKNNFKKANVRQFLKHEIYAGKGAEAKQRGIEKYV